MFRYARSLFWGFLAVVAMLTGGEAYSGEEPKPVLKPEVVEIKTETGIKFSAAFFDGGKDKVVVFVPGAVFDKESWFFLAERLQRLNIASLSLDGKTRDAVWAAVDLLKAKGFKHILLVGGSMGGSAVLDALEARTDESISGIILLAPAGGSPVKSPEINKLFIVSKEDRLGIYSSVKALYVHSSEPKKFVEFDGSEHAQHLFKSPHKEALSTLIADFVIEDN
jgi:predicted alpha/beta hydrolase family esterase